MDIKDCTFQVKWSELDNEWLGTCNEFPSLSWLDKCCYVCAIKGIKDLVVEAIKDE